LNTLSSLLVMALCAAPALAQPPAPGAPPPPPRGPERMAEALKLTQEQQAAWAELHEAHRTETKALFEEGRALHEALRAALAETTPDPLKVGKAAIAADQHRKRMDASRRALEDKLAALLDEEQKQRFQALRALRGPLGPGGPRGRGPGFGPPPPPPPPPLPDDPDME
jgi:Spy/CpxP family protein refolding chaperone